MKNLSKSKLLQNAELLHDEEMKKVIGGYGHDPSYISNECSDAECRDGKVQCWKPKGGQSNDVGVCKIVERECACFPNPVVAP